MIVRGDVRIGMLLACAVLTASKEVDAQAVGSAVPGVVVEAHEQYYELTEGSLGEVIERLNAMRLEGDSAPLSQGLTEYRIRPSWRPAAGGGTCRVGSLELRVDILVTLPAWTGVRWATPAERARWNEILTAIRDHEHRHRDLTIEAAEALHGTLAALRSRGCAPLRRAVAGAMSAADERLSAAHAEIDAASPTRLIPGGAGAAVLESRRAPAARELRES